LQTRHQYQAPPNVCYRQRSETAINAYISLLCLNSSRKQVKLNPHKAASPSCTDRSSVFTRWYQPGVKVRQSSPKLSFAISDLSVVWLRHLFFLQICRSSISILLHYFDTVVAVVTFFNHNLVNCKATLIWETKNIQNKIQYKPK